MNGELDMQRWVSVHLNKISDWGTVFIKILGDIALFYLERLVRSLVYLFPSGFGDIILNVCFMLY